MLLRHVKRLLTNLVRNTYNQFVLFEYLAGFSHPSMILTLKGRGRGSCRDHSRGHCWGCNNDDHQEGGHSQDIQNGHGHGFWV